MPEWTRDIARALAPLGLRPEREREITEELATHLEDRYGEALGRGTSEVDARVAALGELSDRLVPELRRVETPWPEADPLGNPHRAGIWEMVAQDVRHLQANALRSSVQAAALRSCVDIGSVRGQAGAGHGPRPD